MFVYSFVKHIRKSNIAWLPYGAEVVKLYFYYHLKSLFLLYEMKKDFREMKNAEQGTAKGSKSATYVKKPIPDHSGPSPVMNRGRFQAG
jgi:hypothetical protein